MTAKVKSEMSVGLTSEIESALQIATDFQGMKPAVLPAAVVPVAQPGRALPVPPSRLVARLGKNDDQKIKPFAPSALN
jgi:hypothetical protein